MKFRSSRFLKIFAILLFSFEMMAPAILASTDPGMILFSDEQQTTLTSETSHLANLMSALVFEETSSEEERESKDHKAALLVIDFTLIKRFVALTTVVARQTAWLEMHECGATQPPAFKSTHSYLI